MFLSHNRGEGAGPVKSRFVAICATALLLGASACSGSGSTSKATEATGTVWLCKPGDTPDPCRANQAITEIAADGTRTVEHPRPAANPKIDCFYVYPTVSTQKTPVANLDIDPEETAVARAQASRFSSVCRVFAPVYRQRTLSGLFNRKIPADEAALAYDDVKAAWADYLAHDNDGRGVILLGHSQGSFVLTRLISEVIEKNPASLKLLVSAMLLGGNVTVPDGKDVGGSFEHVPVCTKASQTGCVIAYSSFSGTPPANAMFGGASTGSHVVCTNPAALGGGAATLEPAFVSGQSLLGSVDLGADKVATPWVGFPGLFTGECRSNATHTWLQVTENRTGADDPRPTLAEPLGPTWGLHLVDVNIALGDLVHLAEREADAYHR